MSRFYTVPFTKISVSAAQDLVSILGATGKMLRIRRCWVYDTDTTAPTNSNLPVEMIFGTATVTLGSGGASVTPLKIDQGDAAASFTAHRNDTTVATTTGAFTTVEPEGFNVFGGFDETFIQPLPVGPSEGFRFYLSAAPLSALALSGGVLVEEIGG